MRRYSQHEVWWDGESWTCSCEREIRDDSEAKRHYDLDMDRRSQDREHLRVEVPDEDL